MSAHTQQTLTGAETDADRVRPSTLLHCEECGEAVLRSNRFEHPHDLEARQSAKEQAQLARLRDQVPSDCVRETQTYKVEFHYTAVEVVTVEAEHESEAKRLAEDYRSYDGEYQDTVHTKTRSWGEPSPASVEWLEDVGLLPDDHDVSQSDIDRLVMEGDQ
jgi:hypothetical protein